MQICSNAQYTSRISALHVNSGVKKNVNIVLGTMLKHLCGVPVCQRQARSVVSRLRGMLRVIAVAPPFWRTFPTTIWLLRHPVLP